MLRGWLSQSWKSSIKFNQPIFRIEELTIELAVFADDAMWRHFQKLYGQRAKREMQRFIMAAVNNVS